MLEIVVSQIFFAEMFTVKGGSPGQTEERGRRRRWAYGVRVSRDQHIKHASIWTEHPTKWFDIETTNTSY